MMLSAAGGRPTASRRQYRCESSVCSDAILRLRTLYVRVPRQSRGGVGRLLLDFANCDAPFFAAYPQAHSYADGHYCNLLFTRQCVFR
jgi:hypothetical protein